MKYCNKCGNQLDDNVKFCMSCGAKQPDKDRSGMTVTQIEEEPTAEKSDNKKIIWISAIAGTVAVIIIGVILAFRFIPQKRDKTTEEAINEDTTTDAPQDEATAEDPETDIEEVKNRARDAFYDEISDIVSKADAYSFDCIECKEEDSSETVVYENYAMDDFDSDDELEFVVCTKEPVTSSTTFYFYEYDAENDTVETIHEVEGGPEEVSDESMLFYGNGVIEIIDPDAEPQDDEGTFLCVNCDIFEIMGCSDKYDDIEEKDTYMVYIYQDDDGSYYMDLCSDSDVEYHINITEEEAKEYIKNLRDAETVDTEVCDFNLEDLADVCDFDYDEVVAEDEGSSTRMTDDGMMVVPASDGQKIYAYSWNEEFGNRIQYFRDKYPELSDLVEYVNLGMEGTSDDYKQTLLTMLQQGTAADKYPSLFAVDDSIAKYMLSSDYVMDVYDAGFTSDMLSNMYNYTIQMATIDGKLKGLTWQSCPGCFCYRTDIAEEVLGVTSMDEMQAMVSDWDDFWYVAELMKEAGYYMLSGYDDLKYVCIDQNQTPWVTDNVLSIGEGAELYLEYAKYAYENGYTKGTWSWSEDWYNNMDDNVFCYFGCTWFLYWTLGANASDTIGSWRICVGPAAYHWGGSYIGIGIDTPNVELAALVVYTLCCDTEVMTEIFETDYDFVNNKAAIDQAIADGAGTCDLIGNQNPLEVWTEVAENVDLSAATAYDSAMNGFLDYAVAAYCSGEVSYDGAIQYIKEQVISQYPSIIVK